MNIDWLRAVCLYRSRSTCKIPCRSFNWSETLQFGWNKLPLRHFDQYRVLSLVCLTRGHLFEERQSIVSLMTDTDIGQELLYQNRALVAVLGQLWWTGIKILLLVPWFQALHLHHTIPIKTKRKLNTTIEGILHGWRYGESVRRH